MEPLIPWPGELVSRPWRKRQTIRAQPFGIIQTRRLAMGLARLARAE